MAAPETVDQLPPEARFALRAVAAGVGIDEAGALMRLDGPTVRKHLRTAARRLGGSAPPPSEGDAALLAALAGALDEARRPPSRPSSKACPAPDVAEALAAIRLDGPLMLAEIDHVADCPSCLARLVALRKAGAVPAAQTAPGRRIPWTLLAAAAALVAIAAWLVLR